MPIYFKFAQATWPFRVARLPFLVRQFAYVLVGFALWLGILARPKRPKQNGALTPAAAACHGALALVVMLCMLSTLAAMVAWSQVVWVFLGSIPFSTLVSLTVSTVILLAYRTGCLYCRECAFCFSGE